jgi:signal transduction histidine kinase
MNCLRSRGERAVIPAGQASRRLQPLQRLSASRTADDEGIGLRLSIVAAIAKAQHATLTIAPVPYGGLDIEISFPATAAIASATDKALAAT